ncbi:MAG TPA: hypothetical protein VF997_16400, partial [Polyangia bacterium]
MRLLALVILLMAGCGGKPSGGASDGGGGSSQPGVALLIAGITHAGTYATANFLEYPGPITPPPSDLMTLGACK